MAGGNKLEILLSVKSEDSPLNKLKSKMQSILPAAAKVEEKLSKLGNKIGGSGFEKLKAKLSSMLPTVSNIEGKLRRMTRALNNGVEPKIISSLSKLPLIGGKIQSSFSKISPSLVKLGFLGIKNGSILKQGFTSGLRSIKSMSENVFNSLKNKIKQTFSKDGLEKFKRGLSGIKNSVGGIIGKLGGLFGKLGAVAGIAGGLSFAGLAKASDENSLRNSRLKMVTNDVGGLKQKTFAAAQSSGADYGAQLDSIAKLKMLTNGLFNDNEAVKFTSTLDKAFKVSGTGAEEAKSAMYQLNQAMTSGKLQGDEFRSVMENAPILAQKIAESMGVSMAQLKKLGSEGKITSDVIKNAVLGSADEIEAQYSKMPLTFGKVWQNAQSAGQQAMDGLLTKVNQLLNTPAGQKMAQDLQGAFTGLAGMANGALDGIVNIFGKLNFGPLIGPIQQIGTALSQAFSGVGGEGLTNGIANGLNMIISLAGQVAGVIGQMISGINFGQIGQIFSDIGNAVMTLFANIDFGSIGNMFAMAFQQIMQAVSMLTPALAPLMQIFAVIVNLAVQIGTALIPVIGIVLQIGAVLISAIVPVAQVVIGVFAGIVGVVVGVFSAIIGVVASVMGAILAVISGVINSIGAVVNRIATFFTQGFNKAKSIAQGVINAIKGFFDGLAGKVSEIAGKIAGMFKVKPPSWLGFLGGGKGRYIGDKSWEGGPVTVAEKGAEMIRLPSGQQFLANEEMTMNLPQGTRISTAESTRRMMRDQFGGSSKSLINKNSSSSSSGKSNGGNNQYTFSPTVVIENSGGDSKDLVRKVEEIMRRFFEEKFIAMGG